VGRPGRPRCARRISRSGAPTPIFTIADKGALTFQGYYKLPVQQDEHGKLRRATTAPDSSPRAADIMIQGGSGRRVAVRLYRSSAREGDRLLSDRRPDGLDQLEMAGSWSAYGTTANIYSTEISRGSTSSSCSPARCSPKTRSTPRSSWKLAYQNVQDQQRFNPGPRALSSRARMSISWSARRASRRIASVRRARSRECRDPIRAGRRSMLATVATDLDRGCREGGGRCEVCARSQRSYGDPMSHRGSRS